jgi:hypothetical protein
VFESIGGGGGFQVAETSLGRVFFCEDIQGGCRWSIVWVGTEGVADVFWG